jgi:signal transduction histidine kinase
MQKIVKLVRGNLLFWKIAAVFTLLLSILGITFLIIGSYFSRAYFNEVNQHLYGNVAAHLATSTQPIRNGKPDTTTTHDIMHSIMVINPSVEVYLLDTTGKIIDFIVPGKSVRAGRVDLRPVRQFISEKEPGYIAGDNPRQPEKRSIFSAAPVYENGRLSGYVYAILASEKQEAVLAALNGDYFWELGGSIFFVTLLIALAVGLLTFLLITGSVGRIAAVVRRFKEGDYTARIMGKSRGDLGTLTATFNEMADVIVDNMDRIRAADRLRQELTANISHDLRTPLAIMQGYIETLVIKENTPVAERGKYLDIILSSSKKLSHLVQQLFEYSKLEANQITPQKEQFLLDELVNDILIKYEILAKEKDITLRLDSPASLPAVFADVALVERVFQNLLDNALKFTAQHGSILIRFVNQTSGIEVSVADNGAGIALHDQPYIFERYKQSGHEESTGKGMGLGLAIVKKILDLHHTNINIQSIPGTGTTFRFELPVKTA